ncbi:hypothetical protein VPH35_065938 [Triticum aestivum]
MFAVGIAAAYALDVMRLRQGAFSPIFPAQDAKIRQLISSASLATAHSLTFFLPSWAPRAAPRKAMWSLFSTTALPPSHALVPSMAVSSSVAACGIERQGGLWTITLRSICPNLTPSPPISKTFALPNHDPSLKPLHYPN